jgi:hypothetical protein
LYLFCYKMIVRLILNYNAPKRLAWAPLPHALPPVPFRAADAGRDQASGAAISQR